MKDNISKFEYCYGCGVCSASCPRSIISIQLNDKGFYEPVIEKKDNCTECGICLDVCAFNHSNCALEKVNVHSWAAWSNDDTIRKKCSSGGIGFEIGKQLIEQGYKAVGCRYDIKTHRAEHYVATSVEEFIYSMGSKYIQSYTEEAFKQIKRKDEKYLITGTPCQIDSFRRMIQKFHCEENFVLMDFFCHGVPSMWAWKSYLSIQRKKVGDVTEVSWRNKDTGWHDSWMMNIKGEKGTIRSWHSKGDLFYRLFLGDLCLGAQCEHHCKYKCDNSSADIRIGDLWGKSYASDEKGVSALISFTPKGKNVVDNLQNVTLIDHDFTTVAEGQQKEMTQSRTFTPLVSWYLKKGYNINRFFYTILKFQKFLSKNRWRLMYLYKRLRLWGKE